MYYYSLFYFDCDNSRFNFPNYLIQAFKLTDYTLAAADMMMTVN